MHDASIETGRLGRIGLIRLRPNLDLVDGVEAACGELGFSHAMIRSAVGSLVDSTLRYGHRGAPQEVSVAGPGVEILTLVGELRPGAEGRSLADLRGTVGDPAMRVLGGRFVRGRNIICITVELVLQEWLPDRRPGG